MYMYIVKATVVAHKSVSAALFAPRVLSPQHSPTRALTGILCLGAPWKSSLIVQCAHDTVIIIIIVIIVIRCASLLYNH